MQAVVGIPQQAPHRKQGRQAQKASGNQDIHFDSFSGEQFIRQKQTLPITGILVLGGKIPARFVKM